MCVDTAIGSRPHLCAIRRRRRRRQKLSEASDTTWEKQQEFSETTTRGIEIFFFLLQQPNANPLKASEAIHENRGSREFNFGWNTYLTETVAAAAAAAAGDVTFRSLIRLVFTAQHARY
jgi:hypothetical protein